MIRQEHVSGTGGGEAAGSPRPAGRLLGVLLLAVLAGAALGRFAFLQPETAPAAAAVDEQSLETAVAALERVVEREPADLGAWQRLGLAYTDRAIAAGDPAFYALAGGAFDRADGLQADAPDTLLGRGKLALSLHQFSDALDLGERAAAARPANAPSLGVLVDAQVELGRYEQAAETLQRMLDARPDVQSLARASYLRELTGDLPGAILAMREAEAAGVSSAHDRATVAALLGDLRLAAGDVDAAAQAYDRSLELSPQLPSAVAGRARVLAAQGDLDGAVAVVDEAVQRAPVPALTVLHADLLRLGGRDQAAADAEQVVRATAALQRAAGQAVDLEMALFEAERGDDPALAVEQGRSAYDARPDNVFAADALAWALHRAGDTQAALPLVERALRLGGADAAMRLRAATVLQAAGQPDRAREQLEAAFARSPWTALPYLDDARELAATLGVAVPDDWAPVR